MHKRLLLLLFFCGFLKVSAQQIADSMIVISQETDSTNTTPTENDTRFASDNRHYTVMLTDSLIRYAKNYLRKPYNYRLNPQVRFDCSGFSSYVFSQFGYQLRRSSAEQARQFNNIQRNELKRGDLVFFSGRRINDHVGHVGIVVEVHENGKFDFIHSSNQSGIVISRSDQDYYARRYISAGRVIGNYLSENQPEYANHTPVDQQNTNEVSSFMVETSTEPPAHVYHYVVKGDTLYSIARKYSTSVASIKRLNDLQSDKIMPRQRLIVF
jgi:LysM repeat protein